MAELWVSIDFDIVGARSEGNQAFLICAALHETFELIATGRGDLDGPWPIYVLPVVAVDFCYLDAHVGHHGFDDVVGQICRDVEDYPHVSYVGSMIWER